MKILVTGIAGFAAKHFLHYLNEQEPGSEVLGIYNETYPAFENEKLKQIVLYYNLDPQEMETETHRLAASLLDESDTEAAWQVLLSNDVI